MAVAEVRAESTLVASCWALQTTYLLEEARAVTFCFLGDYWSVFDEVTVCSIVFLDLHWLVCDVTHWIRVLFWRFTKLLSEWTINLFLLNPFIEYRWLYILFNNSLMELPLLIMNVYVSCSQIVSCFCRWRITIELIEVVVIVVVTILCRLHIALLS